jgi:hypothetical protein
LKKRLALTIDSRAIFSKMTSDTTFIYQESHAQHFTIFPVIL